MAVQAPTPTEQPEEGVPEEVRAVPTVVDSVSVEAVAPVVKAATGDSERVVLVWGGISNLHRSFFLDVQAVEQLGRDMAGLVKPPANVHISFDMDRHIGRIHIKLLPETATGMAVGEGAVVNLAPISPLLQGLARYRSAVAARYDTRVEAFRIGIDSYRGLTHCQFSATGPLPPDGTVVSGCVDLNGVPVCGQPVDGGILYSLSDAEKIRDCLR
jgi:hypothetical protein